MITEETRKAIHELIDVALTYNNPKGPTIFVEIPGHVQLVECRVYMNGWAHDTKPDLSVDRYIQYDESASDIRRLVTDLREMLGVEK